MSEAQVTFLNLAGNPLLSDQLPCRFTFRCVNWNKDRDPRLPPIQCANLLIAEGPYSVKHGIKHDPQGNNGGKPQWNWDGHTVNPTFTPSINCSGHCGFHGYIRKGRCVETNGNEA
jgi:hypothetical protein